MVGVCRVKNACCHRNLATLFTKICDRPLVSRKLKIAALDSSCLQHARSMRPLERFNADCYLAIMVGPSLGGATPSAVAEISGQTHPWAGSSIFWKHFSPRSAHQLDLPNSEVNRTVGLKGNNDGPEVDILWSKKGFLVPENQPKIPPNQKFSLAHLLVHSIYSKAPLYSVLV